jgi:hypothetical protein
MPADKLAALRGRIGAMALHATHDPRQTTAAARSAFDRRFYVNLPTDLSDDERERRAQYMRRQYFAALAYRSAVARATKSKRGRP